MTTFKQLFNVPLKILKWFGFLLVYLIPSSFFTIASEYSKNVNLAEILLGLGLILSAAALIFVAWRYSAQLSQNNPRNFGRKKINRKKIITFILVFLAMIAVQIFWSWLITKHFIKMPSNQNAVNEQTAQLPLWNDIFTVIIAPIFEELIFRGILMNYFFNKDNRLYNTISVIFSGIVFGFAHELSLDLNWIMYSLLGMALAFAYMWTRDIRYNIGLHMLNNLLTTI